MFNNKNRINIFTDGSCNPSCETGGWAALILIGGREILLKGEEQNATHNRMELLSVIRALEYIEKQKAVNWEIIIYSDSQYVVGLERRKEKLLDSGFVTKIGKPIRNRDLVERLLNFIQTLDIYFVKVKAHQKNGVSRNYNREVDKISRKIVRGNIRNKNN